MRQLTVRLSEEEYATLSKICEVEGYSKVKLVRALIRKFAEDKASLHQKGSVDLEKRLKEALASGLLMTLQKDKPRALRPLKVRGKPLSKIVLEGRE